jgi:endonuclease III
MAKKQTAHKAPASERIGTIIARLDKLYPEATTALTHENPLELLVATILSAQCTDERVNKVTPLLFKKYKTAAAYANADVATFESEIRSTGFFHAKAKNIIGCCRGIVERHKGVVPQTMDELVALPGVGRKTANVVLGSAFGKAEGIVVDTHVKRLSGLLGLTKSEDPEKIETDLSALVPKKWWIGFSHLLIWHGRKVCAARKPLCGECVLAELCPSAGVPSLQPKKARRAAS